MSDSVEVKLDGNSLNITMASFDEAMELKRALAESIKESKLDISPEVLEGEVDAKTIGTLVNAILSVGISRRFEQALFTCAKRATFNNKRVNKDLFEAADMRAYYYPIAIEIIKFNVSPFFKGLSSKFSTLIDQAKSFREQGSEQATNEF